eukprot:scaffold2200_cov413-Prasinococcus_capsulatus_cf.AAC.38
MSTELPGLRTTDGQASETNETAEDGSESYADIIVMRHSERADEVSGEVAIDRSWDPPLTPAGLALASDVALKHLRPPCGPSTPDVVGKVNISTVVSSPYLRCLQTASQIRKALGLQARVRIDNGLGELYNETVLLRRHAPTEATAETCTHSGAPPALLTRRQVEELLPEQVDVDTPSPGTSSSTGRYVRQAIVCALA